MALHINRYTYIYINAGTYCTRITFLTTANVCGKKTVDIITWKEKCVKIDKQIVAADELMFDWSRRVHDSEVKRYGSLQLQWSRQFTLNSINFPDHRNITGSDSPPAYIGEQIKQTQSPEVHFLFTANKSNWHSHSTSCQPHPPPHSQREHSSLPDTGGHLITHE